MLFLFASGAPSLEKGADEKLGKDQANQAYKRRPSLFVLPPRRKESA
jgi:hypothetical protein